MQDFWEGSGAGGVRVAPIQLESVTGLLDPRAWPAALAGLRQARPARRLPGNLLGLPGDVLIAPTGSVLAAYRGRHADDQWSVDELLALADGPALEQGR